MPIFENVHSRQSLNFKLSDVFVYSNKVKDKQLTYILYGGVEPEVPAGILHGTWEAARDGVWRDAGGGGRASAVGGVREARLLQVHGV